MVTMLAFSVCFNLQLAAAVVSTAECMTTTSSNVLSKENMSSTSRQFSHCQGINGPPTLAHSSYTSNSHWLLQRTSILRGGGDLARGSRNQKNIVPRRQQQKLQKQQVTIRQAPASAAATPSPQVRRNKSLYLGICVATTFLVTLAIIFRDNLLFLADKQKLQDQVVALLQPLRPDGDASFRAHLIAYGSYAFGMMVWEAIGLSTIPVETAAGLVFGWWPGLLSSATGKLCGASLAYGLGKWRLRHFVETRLKDNATCQLLAQQSARRHAPWLSALLMKFSCFPETIKNYGTAAFLPSVSFGWFFAATVFHGCMFTALWTWLGVETAQQLHLSSSTSSTAAHVNSQTLQLALGGMVLLGFVVSPASMAWWIRDLRKAAEEEEEEEEEKRIKSKRWRIF